MSVVVVVGTRIGDAPALPARREHWPVALDLADIVHQAVEQPLAVDLGLASEGKTIKAFGGTQIGEHRFGSRKAALIDVLPECGIDSAFHLRGESFARRLRTSIEEHDLAYLRLLGMAKTLGAQAAGEAGGLRGGELHARQTADRDEGAVRIETLARRADAGAFVLIVGEVLGAKQRTSVAL